MWRYYPESFSKTWRRVVGREPTEEFTEVYELMCEALYWGVSTYEQEGSGGSGKRWRANYWFGDSSLLDVKQKADGFLSQTAQALRRWERKGRRYG